MRSPHVYEIELRDRVEDARAARVFLRDLGHRLELGPDQIEAGELALSELVTNAIVHAGGPIIVRVWSEKHDVHIEVIDRDSRAPHMGSPDPTGVDPGGLPIVAATAKEWGWDDGPDGAGKRVWFTLARAVIAG